MKPPKYKYEIGTETPKGQRLYQTGSLDNAIEETGKLIGSMSDDGEDKTIIIRRRKEG